MPKKGGVFAKALAEAAEELGQPITSWHVEKLATLSLMLKVERARYANSTKSDSAALVSLMNEISAMRQAAGLLAPRLLTVQFTEGIVGVAHCPHCNSDFEVEKYVAPPKPVAEPDPRQQAFIANALPGVSRVASPPATPTADAVVVPIEDQRAARSAALRASALENAPLKRHQSVVPNLSGLVGLSDTIRASERGHTLPTT